MAKKKSKSKMKSVSLKGGMRMIKNDTAGTYFAQWYNNYPIWRADKSLGRKYKPNDGLPKDLAKLKSYSKRNNSGYKLKVIGG